MRSSCNRLPDRPVCGLEAGRQQQTQERDDRLVGELLAVDLRGHQIADDVIGHRAAALVNLTLEVGAELDRRVEACLDVLGDGDEVQRQPPEHLQILLRQSQQRRGHASGELERHRLDQIDFAVVFELIDQLIADGVDDLGFPLVQCALLERLAHQAAVVVMLFARHAENRRPEHQPDRLVVHLRGEHRVLAEGGEDTLEVESVQFSGFFSSSGIRSLSMSVPRQTGEVLRMWLKKP